MEENMRIAMAVINKWLYFGWNFKLVPHTWDNGIRKISKSLPEFLINAKWTCNIDHMVGKWESAVESGNPDAYLVRFYATLDMENRKALLEWVMENYNGEMKIVY